MSRGSMIWVSGWSVVALALLLGSACSGSLSPSASVTTMEPAWPKYFKLDWTVEPALNGSQRITGYLYNASGFPADSVQLLAQALDASGSVIGQRLQWVEGTVPGEGRVFFRIDGLPPANAYRVSVWNFELRQTPGGGLIRL